MELKMHTGLQSLDEDKPILFYDGVCGLCDRAVSYLIRRDPKFRLRYCALQTDRALKMLGPRVQKLDTVYLWLPSENRMGGGRVFDRSDAILRAVSLTGGAQGLIANGLLFIPKFARDEAYKIVAKNRLRWFGRLDTCRLPNAEERQRFLAEK
jgi:predicted DCC family thiol-disulfide oxidoreductase YuxK